jgi:hypothetical protein
MKSGRSVWVLTVLVLVSLALNAVTIFALLQARTIAKEQIVLLADQLQKAEGQDLTFDIKQTRGIPVQAVVPIQKQLNIPINTTVNIDQVLNVPINTPLGNTSINIPIKTTIPVNITVPVTLSESLPISTTFFIDANIPITIPMANTPFATMIRDLRQQLLDLSRKF